MADIDALDLPVRPSQPRPPGKRRRLIDPDDPVHFAMPTLKELEAQVRRRSIGRTVADICLDLGLNPSVCDGGLWNDILETVTQFGGNFQHYCAVRTRRSEAFERERAKRPETWTWQVWDQPKDAIRQMLGYLAGEPPPEGWDAPPAIGSPTGI
ncbi:MAG: hypothetical protein WCI94_08045 [Rhodospirillales bacterium]